MKQILVLSLLIAVSGIAQPQTVVKTSEYPIKLGYTVELPPDYDSTKTYPLIVGLHGLGDRMSSYIGTSQALYPEGAIGLYPESPYPFFMENETMGWTWCLWGDSTEPVMIDRELTLDQSIRWIVATIEEVKKDYHVDSEKVFLYGFSQGGMMTYLVGLNYPELFRGLLPGGAWIGFDTLTPPQSLDRAASSVPILHYHGYYDDVMEYAAGEQAVSYLKNHGFQIELFRYPAKHVQTSEMYEDGHDFIWRELNKQDSKPLVDLLWPEECSGPEEHAKLLMYVLCAQEPVADIEAGLLALYEKDACPPVRNEIIYLLGTRRCTGAEEMLTRILNDKDQPSELRQASYSALIKLATESAWKTVENTEKKLVITRVVPGSQADSLGLLAGDIILSYNQKPITSDVSIREAKTSVKPKQRMVEMTILRASKHMKFKLRPGSIGIYNEERIK